VACTKIKSSDEEVEETVGTGYGYTSTVRGARREEGVGFVRVVERKEGWSQVASRNCHLEPPDCDWFKSHSIYSAVCDLRFEEDYWTALHPTVGA
jgi:hypothetical protein